MDSLDARPIVENTPANLDVTQSSLFSSAPDGSWAADMPRELERLLHNVTLSLVANGFTFGSRLKLNATISTSQTQFYYRHEGLWIPYGVAFALVALCCLDGLVAVHSNRFAARGGFKAFLKFTREIKLGELAGKAGEAKVQDFTAIPMPAPNSLPIPSRPNKLGLGRVQSRRLWIRHQLPVPPRRLHQHHECHRFWTFVDLDLPRQRILTRRRQLEYLGEAQSGRHSPQPSPPTQW